MKKNFKRAMAAVMAAALTLSLAGTATEADAAKKIKFAKKSVTVNVKKSKTVKIKGVTAKKVKKLTVKSAKKKIATASKKGKTAVKVTGKKAGSTKVTATLKIKGQKKATKLTLTVKVKKATPSKPTQAPTQAPATSAPASQAPTQAPTQAPDVSAPPAQTPDGPATPAPATKPPTTPKPEWTPDPNKKIETFTVTYGENGAGYELPNHRVIKFDGTVINHEDEENAKASGYPTGGVDLRYYKQVIVKYEGNPLTGGGGDDEESPNAWFGKATLTSTDDGLGQNEYSNGLFLKYLNDVADAGYYQDGVYTVTYDIDENKLEAAFDPDDIGVIDAVSVQLANEADYAGFKLKEIKFVAPDSAQQPTDQPTATPGASDTPDVKEPKVEVTLGKDTLAEGETTTVEVKASQGVIKETTLTVKDPSIAALNNGVVTAKSVGETEISGTVKVEVSGKTFDVSVKKALKVVGKDDLVVNVSVESENIEMMVGDTAGISPKVSVELGGQKVENANVTAVWSLEGTAATVETAGLEATVTAVEAGEATLTLTVTVKSGDKTETVKKDIAITVNEAPVVDRVLTAADLGGADALKYTFEGSYGSQARLITYDFSADEIAKIKDGTYTSLEIEIDVKGATDKSNCYLQPGIIGNKTDMFYGNPFEGKKNASQKVTLDLTQGIKDSKDGLKSLFIQVEWDNPNDDKTIVFDGEIELTSITFKTEAGDETQATIPDASKNSVNPGVSQWTVLLSVPLPSDINLQDYAEIQYEVTVEGSTTALNAHLSGAGLSQYDDHSTGIEDGKATLDLSKYAETITDGQYKVGVQVAEAGFKGNVSLDKVTLIAKK